MKNKLKAIAVTLVAICCYNSANAQVANLRPYDKSGINIFESPKDTNAIFDKLKVQFGAGFTQSFQGLKHENASGGLYKMTPGFNTANANLFMDVQLADGIRLNLTSYLSSRHHNETWVKGGYIQFDKLPFKGQVWEDIMSVTTIKIGHMEINYGDQHFRRSDGGQTLYNPFIENYIMDGFTTEIGGEVLVRKNGLFGLIGVSNGMIKGNIDSLIATPEDDNIHKSPAIYLKGGFDAWKKAGEKVDLVIDVEADELIMDIPHDPNLKIVDVRRETEFADGHLADAVNLPLNEMTDVAELAQFEENENLYIHCAGGYRSVIAASLLKRQGIHNLRNVVGGWGKIKDQEKAKIVKEASVLN